MNILRIDSSARYTDSVGRDLASRLIGRLDPTGTATVVERDLGAGLSLLDEPTLGAAFTPPEARTADQTQLLAEGQEMIDEIIAADAIVIAMPIYNFSAPASLKAWADQVARAGVTFQYTPNGPEGLLADRPAYVIVTSGGVPIDSPADWATGWIRQFLGFIGISSVTVVEAGQLNTDPEAAVTAARESVANLELATVGSA